MNNLNSLLFTVTTEVLPGRSANTSAEARLDFREPRFHPRCISKKHDEEKKREYSDHSLKIEQGTFVSLVFIITGCMVPKCLQFHKSLAEKLASKSGERYSTQM